MAVMGLDPFRYLESRDPLERSMLVELYNKIAEQHRIVQENLAIEIANQVSKLFKK